MTGYQHLISSHIHTELIFQKKTDKMHNKKTNSSLRRLLKLKQRVSTIYRLDRSISRKRKKFLEYNKISYISIRINKKYYYNTLFLTLPWGTLSRLVSHDCYASWKLWFFGIPRHTLWRRKEKRFQNQGWDKALRQDTDILGKTMRQQNLF